MTKFRMICIDGIDKTCKDLIASYLWYLSKKNIQVNNRGIISCISFAKLFGREVEFDYSKYKDVDYVYLTTCKEDWEVRCKVSNEPKLDFSFEEMKQTFDDTVADLIKKGYNIYVYNVSTDSIFNIAKQIIEDLHVNEEQEEKNRNA